MGVLSDNFEKVRVRYALGMPQAQIAKEIGVERYIVKVLITKYIQHGKFPKATLGRKVKPNASERFIDGGFDDLAI